jgi:hypothetical protein
VRNSILRTGYVTILLLTGALPAPQPKVPDRVKGGREGVSPKRGHRDGVSCRRRISRLMLMRPFDSLKGSYPGVAPHEHFSGSSVHKQAITRHFGPPAARKLLSLAACSVCTHRKDFHLYFLRKTNEGKPPRLVLNNLANKPVNIASAVLRSNSPYIPDHHPVQPLALRKALTGSQYSG